MWLSAFRTNQVKNLSSRLSNSRSILRPQAKFYCSKPKSVHIMEMKLVLGIYLVNIVGMTIVRGFTRYNEAKSTKDLVRISKKEHIMEWLLVL